MWKTPMEILIIKIKEPLKVKGYEKRDNYLELDRELKKALEHEGDGDTSCNWCTWNDPLKA